MTTVIQVVGYKNSGKTTLVERLVRSLVEAGYRVGTVKHDAHGFDVDREGTDTERHRRAGARMTAITSPDRTAVMEESPMPLEAILRRMTNMDVVIVEGFKEEKYPKIVMIRTEEDAALADRLIEVRAIVSWLPGFTREIPVFAIEEPDELIRWAKAKLLDRSM